MTKMVRNALDTNGPKQTKLLNGYEMTKLKIKVGTKWPKWYKMTWVQNDQD